LKTPSDWPLIVLAAVTAASAFAFSMSPADAVKSRQAQFRELGTASKNLHDELQSTSPFWFVLKSSTSEILSHALSMHDWFPPDSGPAPGLKTAAKPEIWLHPQEFKARQDALISQAQLLAAAADAKDLPAVKQHFQAVGQACGACHTEFRAKENP
jgi:cytochrome c556